MMNDELYHFGIKGMKWGVRKRRSPTGKSKNSVSKLRKKLKRPSKAKRREQKLRDELSRMSDKDLQTKLNRMRNEQQYIQMMSPKKSGGMSSKLASVTAPALLGAIAAGVGKQATREISKSIWDGTKKVVLKQSDTDDSNELYHFGVKGMKWGVRKALINRGRRIATKRSQAVSKLADKYESKGMSKKEARSKAIKSYNRRQVAKGIALTVAATAGSTALINAIEKRQNRKFLDHIEDIRNEARGTWYGTRKHRDHRVFTYEHQPNQWRAHNMATKVKRTMDKAAPVIVDTLPPKKRTPKQQFFAGRGKIIDADLRPVDKKY